MPRTHTDNVKTARLVTQNGNTSTKEATPNSERANYRKCNRSIIRRVGIVPLVCASLITAPAVMAQSTDFTSIPAVAFVDAKFAAPTKFNHSGTTHHFNAQMFAPVHLPHRHRVTSFKCGGSSFFNRSVVFTLRRNQPQQHSVDMAVVKTTLEGTGFEFVSTNSITQPVIDNSTFNYYIVADIADDRDNPNIDDFCPGLSDPRCTVGFCSIGHSG